VLAIYFQKLHDIPIYMNRKLIHWTTLIGKNIQCNNNCSSVKMPRRIVAVFSVAIHASLWQPFFWKLESHELYMGWCIIKWRIEWSLPEIHRTLYEEVINRFLKVSNSLSLYLWRVVFLAIWHQTFAKV